MVNTERWGDKSTWVSYDSNITWSPATNKENYTFAYGRNGANPPTELPEGEEFDLSCAPWGIGGDSILCKLSYMLPVWDSTKPTAEQEIEVRPVDPDGYGKSKPLILTGNRQCVVPGTVLNHQLGQQDGRITLVDSYKPEFTPSYNPYSDYSFWTQNVITNFNYSKIIIVPYIMTTGDNYTASDIGSDGNYWYWTMDQVISRWDEIEGKKAIKGLLLNVYVGAAGSRIAQGGEFQFNVPQLYPEVEIVGTNWGTNPKPKVDTTTLIANGWMSTNMWSGADNIGSIRSNYFASTRYYNDLTDWKKSLQWWSWHGNPVSYMDDNWTIYQETPVDGQDTVIRPIFNYEGKTPQQVVDYFLKQVALLGFPFVIDPNDVQAVIGENNSICLPVFNSSGVTTGEFKRGTEVKDLPNYLWGDDVWERNKYDPYAPEKRETPWDDNPYTEIQEGYWTGLGGTTYVSSMYDFAWAFEDVKQALQIDVDSATSEAKTALSDFLNEPSLVSAQLYETYQNAFKGVKDLNEAPFSKGYNTNYTDCFLSAIRYPFDISQYFEKATYSPGTMVWGTVAVPNQDNPEDADIWAVKGYNTGYIVQGGELFVEKRFNNFLNYAPYTTAELYIPYCGSVPIDLEVFAGHTIKVKYLVDWFSGSCMALIYRDNVVVDQIPGQIGTPVGIVAEDIQTYQNAMFNGSQTLKSQKAALRGSVVNGIGDMVDSIGGAAGTIATAMGSGSVSNSGSMSASGAFTSGFNAGNDVYQHYLAKKTAQYNLDHTTIDFKQLGSNGPSVGSWNEQTCRLVLYYPTFLEGYNPQEYGHTVGFACLFNDKLENFSGLTVCASVDTSGLAGATEAEKNLIEDALKSGVYL